MKIFSHSKCLTAFIVASVFLIAGCNQVHEMPSPAGWIYDLEVILTTKNLGQTVEIIVSDNGNGIPKEAISKIFQPFFSTKPNGKGTGLGMGLACDIIRVHNGSLKVESEEGAVTKFIIQLPIT